MADENTWDGIKPGVYNVDHFSSSQVGLYIGDIWVDEVTSLSFVVQQNRRPLYGYADQLFRQMSKGQIIVQGQFTINFKEAGYLWLILDHYKDLYGNKSKLNPFKTSSTAYQRSIEKVVNGEVKASERTDVIKALAEAYTSLAGFSSVTRAEAALTNNRVGQAEDMFETFENYVWGGTRDITDDNRQADDPDLNPFDLYVSYGDFAGDDRANHTIIKLERVYIVGSSQQIEIDGLPVMEAYNFLARMRI